MSEDLRKQLRTQGKYSDSGFRSDDKGNKNQDRRHKVSPETKEPPEKKFHKRNSNGSKGANNFFVEEGVSPLKYEENSDHSFNELENVKKAIEIADPGKHVLSKTENGESIILYEPDVFNLDEGNDYFNLLYENTNWHTKNIVIQGMEYSQPRLVAWYGPYPYSYSGATLAAAEMPVEVLEIKDRVEQHLKACDIEVTFNSVLLNLYRDGKDSVAWHSDDELTMGISPTIASVSLGETRKFEMRRKVKYNEDESPSEQRDKYFILLTHGSLITMTGCMQDDWQHRVPKEYHDRDARINLTFRTVYRLERVPQRVPAKETKKDLIVNNNSTKTSSSEITFDVENFPPLSSDKNHVSPAAKLNVNERIQHPNSCFKNDRVDVLNEKWDDDVLDFEQNTQPSAISNMHTYESICATNDDKYEDCVIKNNRSLDSVERSMKVSVDSPVNVSQENNLNKQNAQKLEHKVKTNSVVNDNQKNNFYKKDTSLKFHSNRTNSSVSEIQENNLNKKELTKKWLNIQPNSSVNDNQESSFGKKDPSRKFCSTEAISGVNSTQHNNISKKDTSRNCHIVETNSSVNDNLKNNFVKKDRQKKFRNGIASSALNDRENFVDKKKSPVKCRNIEAIPHVNVSQINFDKIDFPKTYHQEPSSPVDVTQEKNLDKRVTQSGLNVKAKVFVPVNVPSIEGNQYSQFDLEDLVHFELNLIQGKNLLDLSYTLRDKVLERLQDFRRFDREELEFLCKLTDGTQSEKNQRLISIRLCNYVNNCLDRVQPLSTTRKSFDGNSRPRSFGNQSNASDKGRRYQNQGRSNNHRY